MVELENGDLTQIEFVSIMLGIAVGFLSRLLTLRADYRQYPSVPNGYLIHLTSGFVAAALGAVAVPALVGADFVAVTFLSLAIQQFREIRKLERDSLEELESVEFAPRGKAYIDGVAKTFEARNYLALISALVTTAVYMTGFLPGPWLLGVVSAGLGLATFWVLKEATKGKSLKDVAHISEGKLRFEGANLFVDDIFVMNVGLQMMRERVLEEGLGIIIEPSHERHSILIGSIGMRQAIEHEVSRLMGLEKYIAAKRDFGDGRLALAFVPVRREVKSALMIIGNVPVLESNKKVAE